MLLAIDTATRAASIALYNGDGVYAETSWRARENHTVELTAQIAHLLQLAGITKNDLIAIGVAQGPGSFAGLRVGMSVAKGLAWSLHIPLLGIPTLDALASAYVFQPEPVWTILAAGRSRYSVARYVMDAGAMRRASELALVDAGGLIELAAKENAPAIFCGEIDAALENILREELRERAQIASLAMNARRAGYLAELAWARLQRGESDDARTLAPVYMPTASIP
ncbi:MAG: tRNA (adenosine(37)-N6)-threonylcarbamoyltransferase complex dimerization subunit type 1 TsaB [Chloroflexi bacterium]|nr:tRNA (adenosine(37)-N6)-threonylcarbamoyltransferase complex dimerization subunit type 1 TsaB [Chloroflexota bacterium]